MGFNQPGQLIVSDAADLGGPPLQSYSPAPVPSYLVAPQPPPREIQLDLRGVEVQLSALEARVAALEAPGWWRRLWIRVLGRWRRICGISYFWVAGVGATIHVTGSPF